MNNAPANWRKIKGLFISYMNLKSKIILLFKCIVKFFLAIPFEKIEVILNENNMR